MLRIAALLALALPQETEAPTLFVGDPAPPFLVERWLHGEARTGLAPGKVHVVEFWATWCGPCIAGMPHLSRLQRELGPRGLEVVGVAPRPDEWGHDLGSITALLAEKGSSIEYALALDAEGTSKDGYHGVFKGKTIEAWMGGAQVGAIPIAFVIDREGRIAAIAPPLEIDAVVEACLDGSLDLAKAAKEYRALLEARASLKELAELLKKGELEPALALSSELLEGPLWNDGRHLGELADRWLTGGADGEALQLALRAARRSEELTHSADPGTLSLLARLLLRHGERAEAERVQARALALSEGEMKQAIERDFRAQAAKAPAGK